MPTPIPAFAPVDKPGDGEVDGLEVADAVALLDEFAAAAILLDDVDEELEEL